MLRLLQTTALYEMKRKPYKLNAPGDFYVEDGECISCALPASESPNLIGEDEESEYGYHCYFKKQPQTDAEVEDAINAMHVSCCWALRYKGNDKNIIEKIKLIDSESQIDAM